MRRFAILPLILALLLPASALAVDRPSARTLYQDGASGRFLLDGEWLFRLDKTGQGLAQGFHKRTSRAGWTPVRVPHAWNVGDDSPASMRGTIGWYRKDFKLPSAREALSWAVRFESVNYRSRIWLNGRRVGENKGAYIPFEFMLPRVKRRGTNRLVIRVDSRRFPTDFPPSGLTATGAPTGGWWNYGGLLREVYLKRIDTVAWSKVRVRPKLPCTSCAATVEMDIAVRNVTPRSRRVRLTGRFGDRRIRFGTLTVPANSSATFERSLRLEHPRLWAPGSPNLYPVSFEARVVGRDGGRGRRVGRYDLKTGVRSIKVVNGRLVLNGQLVNFRGVGLHEDSKQQGFAVDNRFRDRMVSEVKALGATVMRTHYPLHPYTHELADREGILIWSEIPVYAIKTRYLKRPLVRALATKELRKNIEANQNHPSVMLWSLANELSAKPGPVQGNYIRRAAKLAKELDPTRPVGLAVAAYPTAGCQPEYGPIDVLGYNEYFGWYPGPQGIVFDRNKLSPYLDEVRQCYPNKAIVVSEFGAEANRDGPIEEKGTWAFQSDFINYHLAVHASKPWLSGSIYWALNEFRVRPDWEGGNPRPIPPIHQKGVLSYGDWGRKPAWADLQRNFAATQQYAPPAQAGNRRR